ncbi:hypothetical protein COOONC_11287, partial [Cooperia oncophora]
MHDAVAALFHHAVQALCERTNVLAIALHAALRTNPTLTMRSLLGRQDITASHLGNGFVQLRRCIQLPLATVTLLPFNDTCFAYPRVQIQLRSGSAWLAFVNPSTGVVVVRSVTSSPAMDALSLSPNLTIFHNLILTNFSELVADNQLQELWTVRDQDGLFNHIARIRTIHSLQMIVHFSEPGSLFSFRPFSMPSPFQIWVFFCCVIVSGRLAKSLLITYVGVSYPGLLPLLKSVYTQASPAAATPFVAVPPRAPPSIEPPQKRVPFHLPPRTPTRPMLWTSPTRVRSVEHPLPFSVESIPLPPGSPPPSTPGAVAPAYEFSGAAAPIQDSVIEATPPGSSKQPSSFSFCERRRPTSSLPLQRNEQPMLPQLLCQLRRHRVFLPDAGTGLRWRLTRALPDETPPNHAHHLIHRHPWAQYVTLNSNPIPSDPAVVSSAAPLDLYSHIPPGGYLSG